MTSTSDSVAASAPRKRIPLRNVLYATDFSREADKAFPYAAEFARRFGSSFIAVHVRTAREYLEVPGNPRAAVDADFELKENALRAVLRSDLPHLETQVFCLRGEVWKRLEAMIEERNIGLLVIGTHGRGGFKKVLVGSVAEMIVRRARCPVLTVGPNAPSEPPFEGTFREMLYATDLSEASGGAVPHAVRLAREHGARLTMLHVIEKYPNDIPMTSDEIDASLIQQMEEMTLGHFEKDKMSYLVKQGSPAEMILQVASERRTDLIILGMKKTGPISQSTSHLPFGIAHKVIAQARCAVLSIRS